MALHRIRCTASSFRGGSWRVQRNALWCPTKVLPMKSIWAAGCVDEVFCSPAKLPTSSVTVLLSSVLKTLLACSVLKFLLVCSVRQTYWRHTRFREEYNGSKPDGFRQDPLQIKGIEKAIWSSSAEGWWGQCWDRFPVRSLNNYGRGWYKPRIDRFPVAKAAHLKEHSSTAEQREIARVGTLVLAPRLSPGALSRPEGK